MRGWDVAATAAALLSVCVAHTTHAQQAVTRSAAISSALSRGPRVAIARADSARAAAQIALARQFNNPSFGLGYSKDLPQYHVSLDIPFELPGLRRARIALAGAGLDVAALQLASVREGVAYETDTTYTIALLARERAQLSRAGARDADSLVTLARTRRDAGDGSELDVQLAMVTAGQATNAREADSVDAVNALLALQVAMGIDAPSLSISIADSLDAGNSSATTAAGTPLAIAAAEVNVRAADLAIQVERRGKFSAPSLSVGFDTHDPGGQGNGILPTFGIGVGIPLFNRNNAAVQVAQAERTRATAELDLARIETNAARATARRTLVAAQQRAARSQTLVDGANRVAALSLLAYREGASTLGNVLEAQRTAREALTAHINDVAAARNAASLVQLLEAMAPISTTTRSSK